MRSLAFCVFAALFSVIAAAQFNVPAPANVAAPPADAMKTASGLAYKITKPGAGAAAAHPKADELIMMNYTGWTPDGEMIETSIGRGSQTIPLNTRIPGLQEGIQLMAPGQTALFWIPEKLAFNGAKGPKGPKGNVVYEIDLIASMPNSRPR